MMNIPIKPAQTMFCTVHKLGGSTLASACGYRAIEAQLSDGDIVVVSASGNTTLWLSQLIDKARMNQDYSDKIDLIKTHHQHLAAALLPSVSYSAWIRSFDKDCATLCALAAKMNSDQSLADQILGYGEVWSAELMHAHLCQRVNTHLLSAYEHIYVQWREGTVHIEWPLTEAALTKRFTAQHEGLWVVTGFIGSTTCGQKTTLGPNGTDLTAAIVARCRPASQLVKWTDVDGVYTADPRMVKTAFRLEVLSYQEALELSYFGASIIHPRAIYPVKEKNIPVFIKCLKNPDHIGTKISSASCASSVGVAGLTHIDSIALINVQGAGMMGVSGVALKVFAVVHRLDISVILISQASSEQSICFAVAENKMDKVVAALRDAFSKDLSAGRMESICGEPHLCIIAAVGDQMVGKPGIAARIFNLCAQSKINVSAISQGSSERNISIVVKKSDCLYALKSIHGGLFLPAKTISVGLVGPGGVGSVLLEQILCSKQRLRKELNIDIHVRGVMNSKKMLLSDHSIESGQWGRYEKSDVTTSSDLHQFIRHIAEPDVPHAVIIDCTSSEQVVDSYDQFIDAGLHIVSANKKNNSGDFYHYKKINEMLAKKHCYYFYETTVCAGLPVFKTIEDLRNTGDKILTIQGMVSGTLGYIFDLVYQGHSFSKAVLSAYENGYTEPDPRDDLSGMDVARKFTCLARSLGHATNLSEIAVKNLVPDALQAVGVRDFLNQLPQFDDAMNKIFKAVPGDGDRISYAGMINENGDIDVGLVKINDAHPFYHLAGTDNCLRFQTQRYNQYPLVIQGPGAGVDVTAAGVFADVLRLLHHFDQGI